MKMINRYGNVITEADSIAEQNRLRGLGYKEYTGTPPQEFEDEVDGKGFSENVENNSEEEGSEANGIESDDKSDENTESEGLETEDSEANNGSDNNDTGAVDASVNEAEVPDNPKRRSTPKSKAKK